MTCRWLRLQRSAALMTPNGCRVGERGGLGTRPFNHVANKSAVAHMSNGHRLPCPIGSRTGILRFLLLGDVSNFDACQVRIDFGGGDKETSTDPCLV